MMKDKIKQIIAEHFVAFEGDPEMPERSASKILEALEEADDVIVFDAHNVPHRFAVCVERDCGKIFNACNLEPIKQAKEDSEPVFAGKCPYCTCPAKYLTDHENKIARASYKMADKICQNINTMNSSTCRVAGRAFAEGLARQHRTLQQEFGRSVLYPIVQKFAEMGHDGHTDARNEAFCKLCLKLLPILEDSHLPFI